MRMMATKRAKMDDAKMNERKRLMLKLVSKGMFFNLNV